MRSMKLAIIATVLASVGLAAGPADARPHRVKVCKTQWVHHHKVSRCHWVYRR